MPRPATKRDLLAQSRASHAALEVLLLGLSPADRGREFAPGTMNRNVRDVLGHLHHWHTLLLGWYAVGMQGGQPEMPAAGHTWSTTRQLNRSIHARYQTMALRTVLGRWQRSHVDVMALIERHTEAQLFTKRRYPWTGSTSLGAYLISATCSHYEWARRLIEKGLGLRGRPERPTAT
ncbi:MAG: ClbS/DfsB family four-helix bundle protein [Planctomycetes bacterium]|jgi:hypothetical protein|nr:ClbS/DfsB family four-helix bundle protein [Planctomycetota bacterium]